MSRFKKIIYTVGFLGAIMMFSLLIEFVSSNVTIIEEQRAVIKKHDIDVRALFYTESEVGMKASIK